MRARELKARWFFVAAGLVAASMGLAAAPAPFAVQQVALSGRLRRLSLQDVWEGGGVEALVLERSGSYPDWAIALSVWGATARHGEMVQRARVALPSDALFYAFVPLADAARPGLVVVRPHRTELWLPVAGGWDAAGGPHIEIESALPTSEKGDAAPLEPVRAGALKDAGVDLLVPRRDGFAGLSVTRSAIRQTKSFEVPPFVRVRTGADRLPFEPSFWVRGQLWFPDPVPGSLSGSGEPVVFFPWRDEVVVAPIDGGPLSTLRFNQLTDAERDDGQTDVLCDPVDLDGDGRTDFLVNKFQGAATSLRAATTIFLTRKDGTVPESGLVLRPPGNRAAGVVAVDLDHDGRMELVAVSSQFNAWAIVRALLARKATVTFGFYYPRNGAYRTDDPDYAIDLSFSIDLGDADIEGIFPSLEGDFNGDGFPDAIYATDRESLKVIVQRPERPSRFETSQSVSMKIAVPRTLRIGDLDGDGTSDVVLYDARADGNRSVRFLLNRGTLR